MGGRVGAPDMVNEAVVHVAEAMEAAATNIERPGDDRLDDKRIDDDCIDDDRVDARLRLGEREEGVDGA